jgi:hypothetical protein
VSEFEFRRWRGRRLRRDREREREVVVQGLVLEPPEGGWIGVGSVAGMGTEESEGCGLYLF